MPTLNFPTNPAPNQTYSFGGKTWIWTGQAWRLTTFGAINNIPIGNATANTGAFTTLSANTFTVQSLTASGNITSGNITTGNLTLTGEILNDLTVAGNVNASQISSFGNVFAQSGFETFGNVVSDYYIGNGRLLTGILASTGNLIVFGNSRVSIDELAGPIVFTVDGISNVVVVTTNGITVDGEISASGNVYAETFYGNIIGNISGNLTVAGPNTGVVFNDLGVANSSLGFTFNKNSNTVSVTGNVISSGVITGNGVGLTQVLNNSLGSDPTNWNVLTKMGLYTVNRANWGGVTGAPLDSTVYVGMLEVKTSTVGATTATEQIYYTGTVDDTDVKIQYNRSYWAGSWTSWIRMTSNGQQIDGGLF